MQLVDAAFPTFALVVGVAAAAAVFLFFHVVVVLQHYHPTEVLHRAASADGVALVPRVQVDGRQAAGQGGVLAAGLHQVVVGGGGGGGGGGGSGHLVPRRRRRLHVVLGGLVLPGRCLLVVARHGERQVVAVDRVPAARGGRTGGRGVGGGGGHRVAAARAGGAPARGPRGAGVRGVPVPRGKNVQLAVLCMGGGKGAPILYGRYVRTILYSTM